MGSNWTFWHFGVVVRSMEEAAEYYQKLGIGPFEVGERLTPIDRKIRGKPMVDIQNRFEKVPLGPIKMELVQPVTGQSLQREFLDKHGEGINHIAFLVDDIEEETRKMAGLGFAPVSSGRLAEGGGFAYFDTDRVGGFLIELAQLPDTSTSSRPDH